MLKKNKMSEAGFTVIYVGGRGDGPPKVLPRYDIGERLIVTGVSVSSTTGIEYYMVTDGKETSGGWYDACLFRRLDEIREERLEEIGI